MKQFIDGVFLRIIHCFFWIIFVGDLFPIVDGDFGVYGCYNIGMDSFWFVFFYCLYFSSYIIGHFSTLPYFYFWLMCNTCFAFCVRVLGFIVWMGYTSKLWGGGVDISHSHVQTLLFLISLFGGMPHALVGS